MKPRVRFSLPSGLKLKSGEFPEVVGWAQGFTDRTFNLVTGKTTETRRSGNVNVTPTESFIVISKTKQRPPNRELNMGAFDLVVTGRGLTFKRQRRRRQLAGNIFGRSRL